LKYIWGVKDDFINNTGKYAVGENDFFSVIRIFERVRPALVLARSPTANFARNRCGGREYTDLPHGGRFTGLQNILTRGVDHKDVVECLQFLFETTYYCFYLMLHQQNVTKSYLTK
jgi:hypothetical protein